MCVYNSVGQHNICQIDFGILIRHANVVSYYKALFSLRRAPGALVFTPDCALHVDTSRL
jgi:hypothetical protein